MDDKNLNIDLSDIDPKDLWEPAQPGETLENVWIPNRRERRKMLHAKGKNKKRGMRQMGKILQQAQTFANKNPDYKQDIYRALYENLKKKTENLEEELKNKENTENGTTEGN